MVESGTPDGEFVAFASSALPALRRVAFAWTRDWSRGDDAVQTSLEQLYRAWGRVRVGSDPYPYARKILIRVLMAESRSGWRRHEHVTEHVPDQVGDNELGTSDDGLADAIAKLPPRQRAIVLLRYQEDMSVEEVAVLMNCSTGTVKSQAHSARASLKKILVPTIGKADADDR